MMKLSILPALFLSFQFSAFSQPDSYVPLDTWPYVYESFQAGRVQTLRSGVAAIDYNELNVCVLDGKLHYISSGKVMAVEMNTVKATLIGEDLYLNAAGQMAKVLKETSCGAVVQIVRVDEEEMSKSDIGYGKSSLASTQNVSAAALDGSSPVNRSLDDMLTGKSGGTAMPLKEERWLFFDGMLVKANKYEVSKISGLDKAALKSFLKENRTRFSDADDLSALMDWLHESIGTGK